MGKEEREKGRAEKEREGRDRSRGGDGVEDWREGRIIGINYCIVL